MVEVLTHWMAGDDYTHKGGGFMGKKWDSFVPGPSVWRECLRVLKPGGHLLAFFGSRTYDMGTLAVRLAGFEIRDQIMWVYGSGWPKSHNIDNHKGKGICGCERTKQDSKRVLRPVPDGDLSQAVNTDEKCGQVLLKSLQEQSAPNARWEKLPATGIRREQSILEGRCDDVQEERELQGHQISSCANAYSADGSQGRVHNGASSGDGSVVRVSVDAHTGGASCGSQSTEQCTQQSGDVARQQQPQTMGAWPICPGCMLPMVPEGMGTALKPAHEPIVVARKPFNGTVLNNILRHGVGGLDIENCRIDAPEGVATINHAKNGVKGYGSTGIGGGTHGGFQTDGRWPANLIHDGHPDVVALFPAQAGANVPVRGTEASAASNGLITDDRDRVAGAFYGDTGSAARFFYCAKTSATDRHEGLEHPGHQFKRGTTLRKVENASEDLKGNAHPTVKPTDLMAYLVRLVTPPGGTVLDPYMGSGSTGKACMRERMHFIGIELEKPSYRTALKRIRFERNRMAAADQAEVDSAYTPQLDLFGT